MVIGLGLDLIEIERARSSYSRWGSRLIDKLMDAPEAARLGDLAVEPAVAIAHSIALKEAGSKAIGTGWSRGVRWRDVIVETRPALSVVHQEPTVTLFGIPFAPLTREEVAAKVTTPALRAAVPGYCEALAQADGEVSAGEAGIIARIRRALS